MCPGVCRVVKGSCFHPYVSRCVCLVVKGSCFHPYVSRCVCLVVKGSCFHPFVSRCVSCCERFMFPPLCVQVCVGPGVKLEPGTVLVARQQDDDDFGDEITDRPDGQPLGRHHMSITYS